MKKFIIMALLAFAFAGRAQTVTYKFNDPSGDPYGYDLISSGNWGYLTLSSNPNSFIVEGYPGAWNAYLNGVLANVPGSIQSTANSLTVNWSALGVGPADSLNTDYSIDFLHLPAGNVLDLDLQLAPDFTFVQPVATPEPSSFQLCLAAGALILLIRCKSQVKARSISIPRWFGRSVPSVCSGSSISSRLRFAVVLSLTSTLLGSFPGSAHAGSSWLGVPDDQIMISKVDANGLQMLHTCEVYLSVIMICQLVAFVKGFILDTFRPGNTPKLSGTDAVKTGPVRA